MLTNSVSPNDAIWRQTYWSTMAQIMACCLPVPSHYWNQCSLQIIGIHPSGISQKMCKVYCKNSTFIMNPFDNFYASVRGQSKTSFWGCSIQCVYYSYINSLFGNEHSFKQQVITWLWTNDDKVSKHYYVTKQHFKKLLHNWKSHVLP